MGSGVLLDSIHRKHREQSSIYPLINLWGWQQPNKLIPKMSAHPFKALSRNLDVRAVPSHHRVSKGWETDWLPEKMGKSLRDKYKWRKRELYLRFKNSDRKRLDNGMKAEAERNWQGNNTLLWSRHFLHTLCSCNYSHVTTRSQISISSPFKPFSTSQEYWDQQRPKCSRDNSPVDIVW